MRYIPLSITQKILLGLATVLLLGLSLNASATAETPGDPTTPPITNPYQIDVSTLPHVPADEQHSQVQAFLRIVFTVIGALSLLMFTIGGLRYIASQGDPQAITKAKGTLVYSLVGLLVSICAVAIVTFVIGNI